MGYQVFAVTPATNSDDKCDATGAFLPGAQRFANAFGGSYKSFDNASSQTKKSFLKTIEDGPGSLDIFAYFGHGWKTQLGSAKIYSDKDMDDLAEVLKKKLKGDAAVVLYACWAGFEGGFSTKLQEKLGTGIWVYGHTTLGHSFANPNVSEVQQVRSPNYRRLFEGDLMGAWAESLRYTDMWIRFPIMWDMYIERELNAIRLLGKWKVPNGKTYVFEWSKANGKYSDLASMNQNPSGAVSDGARKGTWTIAEQLEISWGAGSNEVWTMPLKPLAQSIIGTPGLATRLNHTVPGKSQI
jgi:hypothetical protein